MSGDVSGWVRTPAFRRAGLPGGPLIEWLKHAVDFILLSVRYRDANGTVLIQCALLMDRCVVRRRAISLERPTPVADDTHAFRDFPAVSRFEMCWRAYIHSLS